ncbi:MAG TPA: gliding motility-associated C-terminal domain-containing protein [Puia sp.]|nr:gliding motility-associated C-terminal domain-containing protein [Puia sp.]
MSKKVCSTSVVLLLALSLSLGVRAQRMFFNTANDVFEITGSPGNYAYKEMGPYCLTNIESSAMHGDTLYLMTPDNEIYQVLISTGACQYLSRFAPTGVFVNNLTCDQNGLLYFVAEYYLYQYDPRADTYQNLGKVPVWPDGDMLFFNGMLLCSANGGQIWNINLGDPPNSTLLMNTNPYVFWGLYAVPNNCRQNRLYGLSEASQIVEIDPQTWTLKGIVDKIPTLNGFILDGASMAEDGGIKGVVFDSLAVLSPCGANTLGSVQAFASSAPDGGTNYTLDATITNTTGIFDHVATGTHTMHIEVTPSCIVDSVFTLNQGLSTVDYRIKAPPDCAHPSDGQISITANSEALPVYYSINGGAPQSGPVFMHLDTGSYSVSIVDAGHCQKDTTIGLSLQHILPFPAALTIKAAYCRKPIGSISLILNSDVEPATFTAALNGGPASSALSFTGLASGEDTLRVENTPGCVYDTVITILALSDPAPIVQATVRDQLCQPDNGSISLILTGEDGPYLGSMNGGSFTAVPRFDNLAPGAYGFRIEDANLCSWDTTILVRPYPIDSVRVTIDQADPVCTQLNSGSLIINVQGEQAPYWLKFGNSTIASGGVIASLGPGDLTLPVINMDGCVVDSVHARLALEIKPECNMVYLPSAFSPNADGHNDLFRVLKNPYMAQPQLRVFNRYGGLVFASSDQQPGWDGRFHGEPQPPGVYVWEVDYLDMENTPKTAHGTVMLLR